MAAVDGLAGEINAGRPQRRWTRLSGEGGILRDGDLAAGGGTGGEPEAVGFGDHLRRPSLSASM